MRPGGSARADDQQRGADAENPEQRFGLHPKRLALADVLRRLRARFFRPVDIRTESARWMIRARQMRMDATRVIAEAPNARHMLERFEENLDAAVQVAKRKAPTVLLIRHPRLQKEQYSRDEEALFWNGGQGSAYRGDHVTVFYSTGVLYSLMDQLDDRVRRVAQRHGVLYIDPQPALTMSANSFFDHFHLTAQGSDEVARCVASHLLGGISHG